ncbi:MAG: class I SAM-dependent methyltransferase [Flavobacteriaceae bacterium]|nr:class I SAM-dependent methyltransferase [Flavobacteriaceae bacterium]
MTDILGKALLDFQNGNYTEDIRTETNISEEDVLPIPYLFRDFSEMPQLEQKALKLSKGKVLDVGCGAGSHSLYLQKKGFNVTAIDTSKGAIEVCKLRGINDACCIDLLQFKDEKFDTILLLMNGTGIFQKLEFIDQYLQHLKTLLNPNGQLLIDSSDLRYMYDEGDDDGSIMVPLDRYYGELEFIMHYKNWSSGTFDWLYLDENAFNNACLKNGLSFSIISKGENFDYLAKLTLL